MTDELWEARRRKLQDAARDSALALLAHMHDAERVKIPVSGFSPETHVVIALEKL